MAFKDLFSHGAADYARYRPSYPPALFAWLGAMAPGRTLAVDVATGNGQAAVALAPHFDRVVAVDSSEKQLAAATRHPTVEYRRADADALGVPDASADLLVVAQALHWFANDAFFAEVRRVVRPGGVFAAWCYELARITPEVDHVVMELYEDRLGRYWEPERNLIETGYTTIRFPFVAIETPPFDMSTTWTFEQLVGYLGTWSPLPKYIQAHGTDPLAELLPKLQSAWGDAPGRTVRWPMPLRAFRC